MRTDTRKEETEVYYAFERGIFRSVVGHLTVVKNKIAPMEPGGASGTGN